MGVFAVSHYVPLHSSKAGMTFGRTASKMDITNTHSEMLLRLPMYYGLRDDEKSQVVDAVNSFFI